MSYIYRIWIVLVTVYLVFMAVTNRDAILRPEPHDFEAAWTYGINKTIKCELPFLFHCESDQTSLFALHERRLLEEDFNLLTKFVVLPGLSLIVLVIAEKALTVAVFIGLSLLAARFLLLKGP